jgi:hypothetical protein
MGSLASHEAQKREIVAPAQEESIRQRGAIGGIRSNPDLFVKFFTDSNLFVKFLTKPVTHGRPARNRGKRGVAIEQGEKSSQGSWSYHNPCQ